jgi:integration host factor subunit beta
MNKSDLIQSVSKEMNLPLRKAQEVVDMVFGAMSKAIRAEDRIEIRGFGSFSMRHYKGYTGRNPKTGETKVVKPKRLPFFRMGKDLRKGLNEK